MIFSQGCEQNSVRAGESPNLHNFIFSALHNETQRCITLDEELSFTWHLSDNELDEDGGIASSSFIRNAQEPHFIQIP
jgi:hypothetical protein